MITESDRFVLELSTGELFFAASILGFLRIHLPRDPYQGWLIEDIQADLINGRESLQGRGLIRRKSAAEWGMDDYLLAFTQWVVSPEYVLTLNTLQDRGGDARTCQINFRSGQGLLVEAGQGGYRFTLFQRPAGLEDHLWAFLGIAQQVRPAGTEPKVISRQALVSFISGDKPLESGNGEIIPNADDIHEMIAVFGKLSYVSDLSMLEWRGDRAVEKSQLSLWGNDTHLWLTKSTQLALSRLIVQPVSASGAKDAVRVMLSIPETSTS